jgi:heterodisulfide reductase subunit B
MDKAYLYLGCKAPTSQYAYELSTRAIIKELNLPIEVQEEFNCCGFPFIAIDKITWLYLAARNMAVAEKNKRNLVPICNGCFLSFNEAREELLIDSKLRRKINKQLAKEGLTFRGKLRILHLVDIFYEVREDIKTKVTKDLSKKKIAAHLGCHGEEERGEEPLDGIPRVEKMFAIMKDIGLETEEYPTLHECCGAGGIISEHDMPFRMTGNKLTELIEMGFEGMATICPFCQNQYEAKQAVVSQIIKKQVKLPVYYLTQLMGMAFGMDDEALGLHLNASHIQ